MDSAVEHIRQICEAAGPRLAGSAAEQRAAELIRDKLEALGAEVSVEPLDVQPRGFHALKIACVVCYLWALAIYPLAPPLALALMLLLLVWAVLQLTRGKGLAAPLLPTRRSQNVIGRFAAKGQRKQLLLVGAHHDSAYRMPLLGQRTFRLVLVLFPLFVACALLLLGLAAWHSLALVWPVLPSAAGTTLQSVLLACCGVGAVSIVVLVAGLVRSDVVMGANDNLSGVGVALALARRCAQQGLQQTELWVVSFGAEEAGLVGSKAFVDRHRSELEGALLLNLDSVGQSGTLRLIKGELMGLTRHSSQAMALLSEAAREAEIPLTPEWMLAGVTDAASFSRKGLAAATLLRLNQQNYLDHYHNPGDDLPALREECLDQALQLCQAAVQRLER